MMLRGLFLVNWYGAVMVAFGSLEGGVGMDLLAASAFYATFRCDS